MKKLTTTITAATVAILLLFTGCDKYHRDRYIGNWDFVTGIERYQLDSITEKYVLIGCDTIYYLGTVTNGKYENYLLVEYIENHYEEVMIDKYGTIYITCPGEMCKRGNFEGKDSVHFRLGWVPDNPKNIVGNKRKEVNNE